MTEIRYLMDENVNPLLRREPHLVVWQVGLLGSPEYGTLDPEILIWCEENEFLLVTNNRKSMPGNLQDHLAEGRNATEILTLNTAMSIGEIVDELILIASATSAQDYQNQFIYLPIN